MAGAFCGAHGPSRRRHVAKASSDAGRHRRTLFRERRRVRPRLGSVEALRRSGPWLFSLHGRNCGPPNEGAGMDEQYREIYESIFRLVVQPEADSPEARLLVDRFGEAAPVFGRAVESALDEAERERGDGARLREDAKALLAVNFRDLSFRAPLRGRPQHSPGRGGRAERHSNASARSCR